MVAFIIFCVFAIAAIVLAMCIRFNDTLIPVAALLGLIASPFAITSVVYFINYSTREEVAKNFTYMVNIYNDRLEHSDYISLTDIKKIQRLNEVILESKKPKNGFIYHNEAIAKMEPINFYGKILKKEK